MKIKEIRSLSRDEISGKMKDLQEEYFNLRCQHGVGQLEKTSILPKIRKDIARIKTVITELETSKG
jgi:large subunit ribosomal protein L29